MTLKNKLVNNKTIIKNTIKNYFKNLKFIFTPLGIFSFFIVLGLSIIVPNIVNEIKGLISNIKSEISSISFDYKVFFDSIYNSLTKSDITIDNINSVLTKDRILNEITKAFESGLGESAGFATNIINYTSNSITLITNQLYVFIAILLIGIITSSVLTRLIVNANISKRNILKSIISYLLYPLFGLTIITLCIYITSLNQYLVFLALFVFLFLESASTLIISFICHGLKKIKLKEIFKTKNIFFILISNAIIFVISIAFIIIIKYVLNIVAALFIGIPLIEITSLVSNRSVDNYIIDYINNKNNNINNTENKQEDSQIKSN